MAISFRWSVLRDEMQAVARATQPSNLLPSTFAGSLYSSHFSLSPQG